MLRLPVKFLDFFGFSSIIVSMVVRSDRRGSIWKAAANFGAAKPKVLYGDRAEERDER